MTTPHHAPPFPSALYQDPALDPATSFPLDDGSIAVAKHDDQGQLRTLTLESACTPPGLLSLALAALGTLSNQGVCLLRVRDGLIELVPPTEIAVVDQETLLLPPRAIEAVDEENAKATVDLSEVTILHRVCTLLLADEVAVAEEDTTHLANLLDHLRSALSSTSRDPR